MMHELHFPGLWITMTVSHEWGDLEVAIQTERADKELRVTRFHLNKKQAQELAEAIGDIAS